MVVLLAGALALLLLNKVAGSRNRSLLALLIIGGAFLVLLFLARGLPASDTISCWGPFFGSDLVYHVDGLAFLFAAIIALMGLATIAPGLGRSEGLEVSSYPALLTLLAAGLGFVFSANLITLCMSWVIFDLAFLWALIGLRNTQYVLRITYYVLRILNLSCLGCLSLLVAALLLGQGDDSLSLGASSISGPVFGLILLATLIRVGLYPLHLWVPIGVEASRPARSLLHLAPASVGLYLLARLSAWANGGLPYGQVLIIVDSLAFAIGALLAWVETDLGTTLSFVMIGQVGYAVASLAVVKPPIMAVLPSLNLVLCLGLLFLSQDRSEPGSIWSRTALGLAIASSTGVPLTLGFVGRWHLYHSLLAGNHLAFLVLSLLAEAFLFAALLRMWSVIHASPSELAHEKLYIVGAALLAAPVLVLGLHPPVLSPLMEGVSLPTLVGLLRSTTIFQWVALFLPPLGGYLLLRHRQKMFDPVEGFWLKLSMVLRLEWLYNLLGQIAAGATGALRIAGRLSEGRGYLGWIAVVGLLAFLFLRR